MKSTIGKRCALICVATVAAGLAVNQASAAASDDEAVKSVVVRFSDLNLAQPQDAQTLLTCPLNTPVTVTRVLDQDKAFLRFIEQHHLKRGEPIEVEARDAAADSVRIRASETRLVTIGMRAASKLLVHQARPVAN